MRLDSGNVEASEGSPSLNSLTLLRLSITNSLKNRNIDVEVQNEKTSKWNKSRRRKEPCIQSLTVNVRLPNSELSTFHTEPRVSSSGERRVSFEQNKLVIATNSFSQLLDTKQISERTDNTRASESCAEENALDNEEQKNRKKIAQNGMKLASRKFSDSIFENCSTYSLACPEVLQERDSFMPPGQEDVTNDQSAKENIPKLNDHTCSEDSRNFSPDIDDSPDDPVSLGDSFFFKITNDENVTHSSLFRKEGDNANEKKKNVRTEKDPTIPEYYSSSSGAQRRERRLSKKLRRKNKKGRSKDAATYECPKCGVSYILSAKAAESTARCLHCDFWTSVEPEFLKREKQPWNTCRIC